MPLSQSVHGEQLLMANLMLHGETELDTLAISAAPCGHCRQFYSELACAVSDAGFEPTRFACGGERVSVDSLQLRSHSLLTVAPSPSTPRIASGHCPVHLWVARLTPKGGVQPQRPAASPLWPPRPAAARIRPAAARASGQQAAVARDCSGEAQAPQL